jgi:hypothetical protein
MKSKQLRAIERHGPLNYGYPSLLVLITRPVLRQNCYSVQDDPTHPAVDNARLFMTNIFDRGDCAHPVLLYIFAMPMPKVEACRDGYGDKHKIAA